MIVTHSALATPLGLDATTSCAAARAELVRTSPDPEFPLNNKEFYSIERAVISPVPVITDGFEGAPRLWVLLEHVLKDLHQQASPYFRDLRGRAFVALPSPARNFRGTALLAEGIADDKQLAIDYLLNEQTPSLDKYDDQVRRILSTVWPELDKDYVISISGGSAVPELIEQARKQLVDERSIDFAVVLSADSLLSRADLEWLVSTGRLKNSENSQGVIPAEGGAAMILCGESLSSDLGLNEKVRIADVRLGHVEKGLLSGVPSDGRVIEALLAEALQALEESSKPLWLFSDMNGEHYRAHEYGMLQVNLVQRNPSIELGDVWLPALAFGFCESCYPIAAICMIQSAHDRKYSYSDCAFVLTSSDEKGRAVLVVKRG